MATTTTYEAIRDRYIVLLKTLTPTRVSNLKFDECPRNMDIFDYVQKAGSGAIRKFQFKRTGGVEDPPTLDWTAKETNEDVSLTLAYPAAFAAYGTKDRDDLDGLIRADARQIRDLLFSGGNYLPGHSATFVSIGPVDDTGPVWFQHFFIQMIYTEFEGLT